MFRLRRFLTLAFAAALIAPSAIWAQSTDASGQSAPPAPQQQAAPPATDKALTPDQVPNMPAYRRKQANGQPEPAAPDAPSQPVTETQPNNNPNPPIATPPPDQSIYNGPPPTQPLPPPPALPAPPPSQESAVSPEVPAMPPFHGVQPAAYVLDEYGSTYIPLDSWIYPAMLRLWSLGYVDTAYLDQRPWTRRSVMHMLSRSAVDIDADDDPDSEAARIYEAVRSELASEIARGTHAQFLGEIESTYTRLLGIGGNPLTPREGWDFGQTLINDYGRPYANGFNAESGLSVRAEYGRFSAYFRGEYQHAPGWYGYDPVQAAYFQNNDLGDYSAYTYYPDAYTTYLPTAVIPVGTQPGVDPFRVLEADVSAHFFGHEFSLGKHDAWLGPGVGGAFAWSNNAEPIYSFQINRVEPLYIPWVSKVLGPVRYQFFYGDLKGHFYPRHPYVHSEKFTFKPTGNFEFGFQRTVIFGGWGHESVTLHNFLKGFFSASDTNVQEKCIAPYNVAPWLCHDPGARFSQFDFSYRVPGLRKYLTVYLDSFVHDDVSPVAAPTRAGLRPGLYLSQFPGMHSLDLRVEAATTDPPGASEPTSGGGTEPINNGSFLYKEVIQREGITNSGVIYGDPIGRQDKGGQAWLTYHISPAEQIQFSFRSVKASANFIPGGTTQDDFRINIVKRIFSPNFEMNAWYQYEKYKAPFFVASPASDNSFAAQFTWYPKGKKID